MVPTDKSHQSVSFGGVFLWQTTRLLDRLNPGHGLNGTELACKSILRAPCKLVKLYSEYQLLSKCSGQCRINLLRMIMLLRMMEDTSGAMKHDFLRLTGYRKGKVILPYKLWVGSVSILRVKMYLFQFSGFIHSQLGKVSFKKKTRTSTLNAHKKKKTIGPM